MTEPRPETITKKELVNRISEETGQTKVVVKEILQRFLDEIITELSQGNRLEFREFGVFEVRVRAARLAQNPRTLEKVHVPAKKVVKFKVGRLMRERVGDDEEDEHELPKQKAASSKARQAAGRGSGSGGDPSGSQPPPSSPPPSPPPSTPPTNVNSPF